MMSGVRDCLCQINFVFLHGIPVLIGRQPEWEPKVVGISTPPVGRSAPQSTGQARRRVWKNICPGKTSAWGISLGSSCPLRGRGPLRGIGFAKAKETVMVLVTI